MANAIDETAHTEFPPPPEREHVTGRVAPVIAVLVVSAFVMILNETVLTVALPRLMADFAVDAVAIQWLTTGFMLTLAIIIPTTGYLIQRFRTRTLFVAALALFALGTLLAALAPAFGVMMLARVIQAAGTAIILPLLMTTTLTSVPPQHRGAIMGLNSVVISVAPAIGPTVAGAIIAGLGWRALFWLMLTVGVLALIAGVAVIRTSNDVRKAPFDVFSLVLAAFAFGGIVYALASVSAAVQGAWVAPAISLVVGVFALVVFIQRQKELQRTSDAALLDLRPLTVPTFRRSLIVVMAAMATMLGTVIVLPITLQVGLGASVLTTGLLLLPGGLVQGVVSPLAGRLYDRVGPRPLVIPGTILMAVGAFLHSTIGVDTELWHVIVWNITLCLGMALVMTPLMTVSLSALPRELYGHGSAIMNTMQQLAGAAGTALFIAGMTIGAGLAAAASDVSTQIAGNQAAFLLGAVIALVGVAVAPLVRRLPAVTR